METAIVTGNAEQLRRAAHSLKSNSANLGAMALSARCKELEMMGKAGTLEGADGKLAVVTQGYEQARAALEAIRTGS
jgi:HPt (histidine-containing phosphotransfer) domain-containing protein